MGNISSANFKKSKDFQVWHNADIRPSYAIGGGLEVNRNGAEALELKNQIIQQAIDTYNHTKKPKAPAFKAQSYEWSLVINLKESSTLEDCEQVAKMFAKDYGFQCYQIAIHRDEGHIDENGERHINHHAHLEFITLDKQTGKNRFRAGFITPKNFSVIQDKVAQILQMERGAEHYKAKQIAKSQGKKYNIPKRIEPRAYGAMKEREKAERKADLEKINDLKADNTILEQMAESAQKERDRLKSENATLKEKNAEFELTRQAWIAEQNKKKEDYRALSALKQDLAKKNLTIEQVREYIENLENELRKEREERKKAENDRARLAAELESKTTQNRDFAPINSAALDTHKPAETTQGVEITQKNKPKIDAPVKKKDSFKISADKDFKEILAESNISVTYHFSDETDAVYTNSSLYLPKAKEMRDKLENKGYYVQLLANNNAEQENRIALAFAKSKLAFEKICETASKFWKSIYKTSEIKLIELQERLQQKTPKTATLDDFDAKMRLMDTKIKETNATSPAELRKTLESQNKAEQMKEQVKKHAYNQRETPKRDLDISR